MSLARLLSLGRTLNGQSGTPARYRMPRPGAMPKFGTANPFASAKAESLLIESASPKTEAGPQLQPKPQVVTAPTARSGAVTEGGITGDVRRAGVTLLLNWRAKLIGGARRLARVNPFAERSPLSPIPNFVRRNSAGTTRAAVQTELSLDNLKVVRNDLSDADFEVVTRRPFTKKQGVVASAPIGNVGSAGQAQGERSRPMEAAMARG